MPKQAYSWLTVIVIAMIIIAYAGSRDTELQQLMQPVNGVGRLEHLDPDPADHFAVTELAEPDRVTIIEFYTESCLGCRRLKAHYRKFLPLRPDIMVKRVRMPDNWTPDWAYNRFHLNIAATPHILIFDANGKLVAADTGFDKDGFDLLYKWMNAELRQQWNRQHQP